MSAVPVQATAPSDISNSAFLSAVLGPLSTGQCGWVCTFRSDPSDSQAAAWSGRLYKGLPAQSGVIDRAAADNAYFCTAVLQHDEGGEFLRRKSNFSRLAALVLDDANPHEIGTFTWAIQTSPGKYQVGIKLDASDPDVRDLRLLDSVMHVLGERGLIRADASGNNVVRYARLPVGSNTKPRPTGNWSCQLETWAPDVCWSLADACAAIGVDLDKLRVPSPRSLQPYRTDRAVRTLQGVAEGRRNEEIFNYARSYRDLGLTFEEARELLLVKAAACTPPLPTHETLQCLKSAYTRPPKLAPRAAAALSDPIELDWGALPAHPPEVPFVIPGWMPDNVVTLLAAHGGTGKSFLSLYIGLCLAVGRHPFAKEAIKPVKVVLYSAEDGEDVLKLRLRRYMNLLGVDEAEVHERLKVLDATEADNVLFMSTSSGAATTPRYEWLHNECQAFGASVLIFDNASDGYSANENDRALVRQFFSALRRMAPAVLLLSHVDAATSMADPREAKGYSGSTAWSNSARSRWFMAREKNNDVVLRVAKTNYAKAGVEATLRWDEEHKVFAVTGVRQGQPKAQECAPLILTLLHEQLAAGVDVSPAVNAANSIHNTLKHDPRYPNSVKPAEVGAMTREWISTGQVVVEEFRRSNRTLGQRLRLPSRQAHRVAQG